MATLKYLDLVGLTTYTTNLQNYLTANYQPKGSYSPVSHTHKASNGLIAAGTGADWEVKADLSSYTKNTNAISDANKLYAVQLDANGKLAVNVPWVNTTYSNNVSYTGTLTANQVAVFSNTSGVIKASGYTIATSVPANALFTDEKVKALPSTGKFYILGHENIDENGTNPTTSTALSNSGCYVEGGKLYSGSAVVATETYVDNEIKAGFAANDAMVFKGTLGTGGTVTTLPTSGYSAGWTYKVITAGTYAGQTCGVGDMVICTKDHATGASNSDWSVVQNNIDKLLTLTFNNSGNGASSGTTYDGFTAARTISYNTIGAAPTSHASTASTYGLGTTTKYGHVKISNGDVNAVTAADGLVAGMDHTHSNYSTTDHGHNISVNVTDDTEVDVNLTGGALSVNGSITHAKKLGSSKQTTANATAQKTPAYGGTFTFTVPQISANEYGHVTTLTEQTVTVKLPASDNTTGKNVVCNSSTGTANTTVALTNGNVYLNHIDGTTKKSSHKITGTGIITVTTDTSGNISINADDNTNSIKEWANNTFANTPITTAEINQLWGITE